MASGFSRPSVVLVILHWPWLQSAHMVAQGVDVATTFAASSPSPSHSSPAYPSLLQPPAAAAAAAAVVTHARHVAGRAVFMLHQHPKHEAHTGSSPNRLRVRGSESVTRRRAFNPRSVLGLEQSA